jgi:hypothetical protein
MKDWKKLRVAAIALIVLVFLIVVLACYYHNSNKRPVKGFCNTAANQQFDSVVNPEDWSYFEWRKGSVFEHSIDVAVVDESGSPLPAYEFNFYLKKYFRQRSELGILGTITVGDFDSTRFNFISKDEKVKINEKDAPGLIEDTSYVVIVPHKLDVNCFSPVPGSQYEVRTPKIESGKKIYKLTLRPPPDPFANKYGILRKATIAFDPSKNLLTKVNSCSVYYENDPHDFNFQTVFFESDSSNNMSLHIKDYDVECRLNSSLQQMAIAHTQRLKKDNVLEDGQFWVLDEKKLVDVEFIIKKQSKRVNLCLFINENDKLPVFWAQIEANVDTAKIKLTPGKYFCRFRNLGPKLDVNGFDARYVVIDGQEGVDLR